MMACTRASRSRRKAELPAIFVRNDDGTESLLNFSMDEGDVILHRVARRFILRRGHLTGCIVNKGFVGSGERLKSDTVSTTSSVRRRERAHEALLAQMPPSAEVDRADTHGRAPTDEPIAGERGIPSVNRARSLQSRVSSVLAMGLMSALGLGLLTWYYAQTLTRPAQVQHAAQAAAKNRAQGEMALPSLGRIDPPRRCAQTAPAPAADRSRIHALEQTPGPRADRCRRHRRGASVAARSAAEASGRRPKSPGELALRAATRRSRLRARARRTRRSVASSGARRSRRAIRTASMPPRARCRGATPQRSARTLNALLRPTRHAGRGGLGAADAAPAARQGRLHRLHARDRDRLDAPRA